MVRCSTFALVLAWTAASVLAVGPEAFARTAHSYTAVASSPYDLVLEVRGGNETVGTAVRVTLDSQLKVGQFKFSHQDLVVPVSGIPLAVIRTYDSFDTEARDFGIGWSYSIVDVEMEIDETRAETLGVTEGGEEKWFSMRTGGGRNVTLTMPDTGRRATFMYNLQPGQFRYTATWTAPPGVYAKLEPTVSPYLIVLPAGPGEDPLIYWEAAGPYTPREYFDFEGFTLTTKDGTQYLVERESLGGYWLEGGIDFVEAYGEATLTKITQRTGDRIEIAPDLVQHKDASGDATRALVIVRDAAERITAIYDPAGVGPDGTPTGPAQLVYEYDTEGRLVRAKQLKEADPPVYLTTEYLYGNPDFPHFVTGIKDPRGVTPLIGEYDTDGRLIATIDAYGNRIELKHDLAARTETVYDRLGNPTVHAYDARGNVVLTIDAQGNQTARTYDAADNMLTVTNPLGHTTTYTYDAAGNRTSVTDPLGNVTRSTYDGNGNVTSQTDALGNKTTFAYDASGNLLSTTNALGQTTTNVYDANGRLTTTKDAEGTVTASFGYDASGNMISSTDAAGFTRTFGYDAAGRQTSASYEWTNPNNPGDIRTVTTQAVHDSQGNVTRNIDPDGNEATTAYNEIAKPFRVTDVLGNVTETTYDARGNVIETEYPDGSISRTVYDEAGRAVISTSRFVPGNPARATRTVYDSLGRAVRTERLAGAAVDIVDEPAGTKRSIFVSADAVASSTTTVYDAAGRVVERVGPREGQSTRHEYDKAGRNVAVVDALGNRTEYEYDDAGRRVLMRDALKREIRYEYDVLGRQVKTIFPDGTFTATGYDTLGRKISETDQAGVATYFEHDDSGRLTAVKDALDQYTRFTYDERGNRLTQKDANEQTTGFEYNYLDRQVKKTLPLGQYETYEHDAKGNVVLRTDFNGQKARLGYDSMNLLASKDYGDDGTLDVEFTYTATGKRKTVTDSRGVKAYAYDELDRLVSVTHPDGRKLEYAYDEAGNQTLSRVRDATGAVVQETKKTYDALNRLETVVDSTGTTRYTYTAVGSRESVTYPNGTVAAYTYSDLNRLTDLVNKKPSGEVITSYHYDLGPTGNRLKVTEHDGSTVTYIYDDLYRLTSEVRVGTNPYSIVFTYDPVGNRKTQVKNGDTTTYTYDDNDRLITETGPEGVTTYEYDANGSTTAKLAPDGATTYEYDHEKRLTKAITPTETITYAYDGDGNRVSKSSAAAVAKYLVDTNNNTGFAQVAVETNSAGTVTAAYTYGDDLLSQSRAVGTSYYHYDGLGSTRALSDPAGSATDTYTYEAFGELVAKTGSTPNDYLFTGEQYDPNIGFYYLRARYYNPSIGRFHTVDPWGGSVYDPVSLHKYLYCQHDPVNCVDPSGRLTLLEIAVAVFVVVLLASLALYYFGGGREADMVGDSRDLSDVELQRIKGALSNDPFAGAERTEEALVLYFMDNLPGAFQIKAIPYSYGLPGFFTPATPKVIYVAEQLVTVPEDEIFERQHILEQFAVPSADERERMTEEERRRWERRFQEWDALALVVFGEFQHWQQHDNGQPVSDEAAQPLFLQVRGSIVNPSRFVQTLNHGEGGL